MREDHSICIGRFTEMSYRPIQVDVTKEMIAKAHERDKGKYNDRSFMDGKGNFVGFLGEYITHAVRPDFKHVDTFNYDFLWKGRTIDAKTKHQTVPQTPPGYYEASVDVNSMHQETDYYIFCRIYRKVNEWPYGWILGGISKQDFLDKARKLTKGDQDGNNGYVVKQDCYNIRYDQLRWLKKL
jgi:hypothetical protein